MPRRRWLLLLLVLPVLPALAGLRLVRLGDGDMAPSLRPGDWVLLGPGEPAIGDVWLLEDPAEPGRPVLRRIMALPGHTARWRSGRYQLDGETARIREMGRDERGIVLSEGNRWLIRIRVEPTLWDTGPVEVPADRVWLMADERDLALDSRWWGPVPQAALRREVWLRLGPADAWRGRLTLGAEDGPWYVPPPAPLTPPATGG